MAAGLDSANSAGLHTNSNPTEQSTTEMLPLINNFLRGLVFALVLLLCDWAVKLLNLLLFAVGSIASIGSSIRSGLTGIDLQKRVQLAFACLLTANSIPVFLAGEEFADQNDLGREPIFSWEANVYTRAYTQA